jgi:hypothetical protein
MNNNQHTTAILFTCIMISCSCFGEIALYSIHPNCIDYLFKGKTSSNNKSPILSFNTLDNVTIFKTIGDKLGDYTILSYSQHFDKVFVETISSYKDKDASTVVLLTPDEEKITLTVDQPKETQGLLAAFIDTENGYLLYAKEKDNIDFNNKTYTIDKITTNSVLVYYDNKKKSYIQMTENAKNEMFAALQKKHNEQQQLALMQQQAAKEKAIQDANIKTTTAFVNANNSPKNYAPRKTTTKFVMGTEYAYPIRYTVFPVTKRNSKGNLYFTPVVVPKEFSRGYTGFQNFESNNGRSQLNVIRR